jgi:uncharacterized protein (DUF1778 family)
MTPPRSATAPKETRFQMRLGAEQKALLERAAALQGRTLTDFAWAALQKEAENVIRESAIITLSQRDAERFAEALLNPKPLPPAFDEALADYRKRVRHEE